jgi:hypothetical protein
MTTATITYTDGRTLPSEITTLRLAVGDADMRVLEAEE